MLNGNRENLRGFIAQLRLKLDSSPHRFPTPALRMAYTINRLEGTAPAQALSHVTATGVNLPDFESIVIILENAFADPDAAATARPKLATLRQGNQEFSVFFAEFQHYIAELNWDERASWIPSATPYPSNSTRNPLAKISLTTSTTSSPRANAWTLASVPWKPSRNVAISAASPPTRPTVPLLPPHHLYLLPHPPSHPQPPSTILPQDPWTCPLPAGHCLQKNAPTGWPPEPAYTVARWSHRPRLSQQAP